MNREFLLSLSVEELFQFARNQGIDLYSLIDKEELVDKLIEWLGIEESSEESKLREFESYPFFRNTSERVGELEYPIPERYGETKVVLLVKDPDWAFVYWDIEISRLREIKKKLEESDFVLRIYEFEEPSSKSESEYSFYFDIPIQITDFSWYVNLPNRGSYYRAEIGLVNSSGFELIASSNIVSTPCGRVSLEEDKEWILDGTDRLIELSGEGVVGLSSLESGVMPRRITTLSGFHHFYGKEE